MSVLGQNYPNLEYIIMDGGSNDNSIDIIKKYASQITYWISEKDNGQAAAINNGFKIATGHILLWLNSDDMLMPNVLFYIADVVAKHGDNLFFGDCIHFRKQENGPLDTWGSDVANESRMLQLEEFDYIIQPSSFWTKRVWEETGLLNENLHYGFDWEWFLRVKQAGFQLLNIDKCLSLYRYHNDHKSQTGNIERQKELLEIYKEFCPDKAKLYALLINEKNSPATLKLRLIRRSLNYSNRTYTYGELLKISSRQKYAAYSAVDIDLLVRML